MGLRRRCQEVHLSARCWSSCERGEGRQWVIGGEMRQRCEVEGSFERVETGSVLMSVTNEDGRIYRMEEGINIVDLMRKQMPYLTLFRVDQYEMQARPHTAQ